MHFDLERWGLSPALRAYFNDAQDPAFSDDSVNLNLDHSASTDPDRPQLARIIGTRRGPLYDLITAQGPGEGVPRGALFAGDPSDAPVVGDWVKVRPLEAGRWVLQAVHPRRGVLARRGAGEAEVPQLMLAHVDRLWVMAGLDGDFNPRRIERMLVAAKVGGLPATVLLNKTELCPDPAAFVARIAHDDVRCISAHTGLGLDALRSGRQPGETIALLGSSGVGKSSLVNALAGEARQAVSAVRSGDDRGRHTTVGRRLLPMAEGWLLADLPGVRVLSPWGAGEAELDAVFADVAPDLKACGFRDCAHAHEPGCAVQAAIAAGHLDERRFRAWQKLQREQIFEAMRGDGHAQRAAARTHKKQCRDAQTRARQKSDWRH